MLKHNVCHLTLDLGRGLARNRTVPLKAQSFARFSCKLYITMYIYQMTKTYSVADARAHLPQILDEVEAGSNVGLSRRGRLVAVVLSSEEYQTLRGERVQFGDAYRAFLQQNDLAQVGLGGEAIDSLRDKTTGRKVRL
jgi:prevent-host-death family protein